jgi:nucleoid-associated protein YgaU
MTRETKIGLLVGLAFLIVLGVLISDHVITSTDAKPAPVAEAGETAREALNIPGGANPHNGTPVTPGDITPAGPVQTHSEVERTTTGSSSVVVGPSSTHNPVQITSNGGSASNLVPTMAQPQTSLGSNEPLVMEPAGGPTVVVGQPTSAIVLPDPTSPAHETSSNIVSGPEAGSTSVAAAAKEYKAVAGDTVAKMAKRFYGADTKANRDLIVNANTSLKADPRKVVVGKAYSIPKKAGAPETTLAAGPTTLPAARTETLTSDRTYTVKAGDNIWRIAKDQLKDLNAVSEIRKLNADVLKSGDNLKVGTKLRLPAKKG